MYTFKYCTLEQYLAVWHVLAAISIADLLINMWISCMLHVACHSLTTTDVYIHIYVASTLKSVVWIFVCN